MKFVDNGSLELSDSSMFLSDGHVSLVGNDVQIRVKVLLDTGVCHSFIVDCVAIF